MYHVIAAVITAVASILVTIVFWKVFSPRLIAATMLCSIAFIYVGFSLMGNTTGDIVMEVLMALVFYFIALTGYVKNPALLGYGIIAHGVWDILHHESVVLKTNIPSYWPVYCFIIDIIYGVYFLMISKKLKLME